LNRAVPGTYKSPRRNHGLFIDVSSHGSSHHVPAA
jgi:hypothetical protein